MTNTDSSWRRERLKWVCSFKYGDSLATEDREPGVVPVYGSNGIVGYHNVATTKTPCLIIGRKGSFGKLNYSDVECFPIDTTYYVDATATQHHIRWLYYSLQTLKLDQASKDTGVPGLSREEAYEKTLLLPPFPEQLAIANYLDAKTKHIDDIIAKKQRLVDLLREERTAIINRAVTKGVDPQAKMKHSGVEWLGEIPAHWDVSLVKRYYDVRLGKMLDSKRQNGDGFIKPYLRAANIHWGHVLLDEVSEMRFLARELGLYRLQNGDLLVTEGGVTVGRSAIWNSELEECYIQNSINRVRAKKVHTTKFLYYWLYSLKHAGLIDLIAERSTFGHLTKEKLENLVTVLPSETEIPTIVDYLDSQSERVGRIISRIEREIELLEEFRGALIDEVVTGKTRVV